LGWQKVRCSRLGTKLVVAPLPVLFRFTLAVMVAAHMHMPQLCHPLLNGLKAYAPTLSPIAEWTEGICPNSTFLGCPLLTGCFHKLCRNTEGLDCWGPVINLNRDPRWGRNGEGGAEDPYLMGEIAAAWTEGFQGGRNKSETVGFLQGAALILGGIWTRRGLNWIVRLLGLCMRSNYLDRTLVNFVCAVQLFGSHAC
jgi:hypothetical protein